MPKLKTDSYHSIHPIELIGRKEELMKIVEAIQKDEDLVIAGAIGSGRLRLALHAAEVANARSIKIDCLQATTIQDFINTIIEGLYKSLDAESYHQKINDLLLKKEDYYILNTNTNTIILKPNLSKNKQEEAFRIIIKSVQETLEKNDLEDRIVIIVDRLYTPKNWDEEGEIAKFCKEQINKDPNVSYILIKPIEEPETGSCDENTKPTEKIIELSPLPRNIMINLVTGELEKSNLCFSLEVLDFFLNIAQGRTEEAMLLIKYIINLISDNNRIKIKHKKEVNKKDVENALNNLIKDFSSIFELTISILTESQLQLLECLAIEPTPQPHSKTYIQKHGLMRGGTLQNTLKSLLKKGLIHKSEDCYRLTFPLLAYWLKNIINNRTQTPTADSGSVN